MKKQTSVLGKHKTSALPMIAFSLIALLVFGFLALPETIDFASAEGSSDNTVTLDLNPMDESTGYYIYFRNPSSSQSSLGSFGVVGLTAKVTTSNSYGYSLYMRSTSNQARLYHTGSYISSNYYIDTLTSAVNVTSTDGAGWTQKNSYGYSLDWNPNSGYGTFNPVGLQDNDTTRIKRTIVATDASGDVTNVYFGALVDESLATGTYNGQIVFTALANSQSDVSDDFYLIYNANGGYGTPTTDNYKTTTGETSHSFTISPVIPRRSTVVCSDDSTYYCSYTFLGWDESSSVSSPTYAYSSSTFAFTPSTVSVALTTSPTSKTLYAIWDETRTAISSSSSNNQNGSDSSGNPGALGEDTIDLPENILEVIRLIRALPDAGSVTLKDAEQIEKTRSAYEALSTEDKALISSTLVKKYNSVLAAYYSLVDVNNSKNAAIIAAASGAAVAVITGTALFIVRKKKQEKE